MYIVTPDVTGVCHGYPPAGAQHFSLERPIWLSCSLV